MKTYEFKCDTMYLSLALLHLHSTGVPDTDYTFEFNLYIGVIKTQRGDIIDSLEMLFNNCGYVVTTE